MKKEVIKIEYICDFCKNKTPDYDIVGSFKVVHSTTKDTKNYIQVNINPVIEYGPENPDICRKCVIKLLEKHLESMKDPFPF